MAAISGTTVQKTLKLEATTIYGKATTNGAADPTLITANGASKGIASITRYGAGIYDITLDEGIAVKQFLGATSLQLAKSTTGVGESWLLRVVSETPTTSGAAAVVRIAAYNTEAPIQPSDIAAGFTLSWTFNFTPSPVF